MKIIVTKEELLELCSKCAEWNSQGIDCTPHCPFSYECAGAYIDLIANAWHLGVGKVGYNGARHCCRCGAKMDGKKE